MKKLLVAGLLGLSVIGCREKVEPGYVGVIVSLSGDDKGVHETAVGVGKYYVGWNEELHLFPTFTKTYSWTKSLTEGNAEDESISFQTKEGLVVNSDFGITLHVDSTKAATLFQKYRRNTDEIIDSVLRNLVRDALIAEAAKLSIEDVISSGKTAMMERVNESVKNAVAPNGIVVERISIIGEFRPPANIIEAINSKIQATQNAIMVENQLRQTEAEAKKSVMAAKAQGEALLAKAEAEAKANRLLADSLSSTLISRLWIEKWDGQLPTYSASSMPTPMISISK